MGQTKLYYVPIGIRFPAVTAGCCNWSRPFNFKLMAGIILLCETMIKIWTDRFHIYGWDVLQRVIFTTGNPNPFWQHKVINKHMWISSNVLRKHKTVMSLPLVKKSCHYRKTSITSILKPNKHIMSTVYL